MVPETGVEPVRNFVAADFKSATSTNSVIPAPKPMLRTLSGFRSVQTKKRKPAASFFLEFWSGRRVSNSRPQPWQGCALPTELLPQMSGGARRNRTAVNGFAIRCIATLLSRHLWSGRRVSNSRPQPWQGCALPTELLPHLRSRILHRFLEMSRIPQKKIKT